MKKGDRGGRRGGKGAKPMIMDCDKNIELDFSDWQAVIHIFEGMGFMLGSVYRGNKITIKKKK